MAVSISTGSVMPSGTQPPADGQAILGRHHQVQHEQVIGLALEVAVQLLAIGHGAYAEPLAGQEALQHVAQLGLVVQHKDAVDHLHGMSP